MLMNDDKINVAAVFPDGLVKFYGELDTQTGTRPYLRSEQYSNYGQAKVRADEFEEGERAALIRRAR